MEKYLNYRASQVGIKTLINNFLQEELSIKIPYHKGDVARVRWSFIDYFYDLDKFNSKDYFIASQKYSHGAFSQRGIICVYSIDSTESFTIIKDIISKILDIEPKITLFLVANKIDLLETNSKIDQSLIEDGQLISQNLGITFDTISSKIGTNVIKTFNQLENHIISKENYYPISITYFEAKKFK